MRKRKQHGHAIKAEAGADYGPSLRPDRRGRLVAWGGAGAVDIEHRPDPAIVGTSRIVRGARRRDALADLEARRIISKRMRDAGERFLSDLSIASGGTASDGVGMPSIAGPRAGLPERQVQAMTRINQVRHLLQLHPGTVFWWIVFDNRSLTDFESAHHLRNGSASGMLAQTLEALDLHYHGSCSLRSA